MRGFKKSFRPYFLLACARGPELSEKSEGCTVLSTRKGNGGESSAGG